MFVLDVSMSSDNHTQTHTIRETSISVHSQSTQDKQVVTKFSSLDLKVAYHLLKAPSKHSKVQKPLPFGSATTS